MSGCRAVKMPSHDSPKPRQHQHLCTTLTGGVFDLLRVSCFSGLRSPSNLHSHLSSAPIINYFPPRVHSLLLSHSSKGSLWPPSHLELMASVSEDTQPATEGAAAASTMTIPGWVRGPLVQPLTLTLEGHEGSGAGRGSSMVGSAGSERSKRSPDFRRWTPISAGTGEIDQQQQEEEEHPGRHSRRNVRGCCCCLLPISSFTFFFTARISLRWREGRCIISLMCNFRVGC